MSATNVGRRIALLLVALALIVVAGCTQPSGTSGPGAPNQPSQGGKPGY